MERNQSERNQSERNQSERNHRELHGAIFFETHEHKTFFISCGAKKRAKLSFAGSGRGRRSPAPRGPVPSECFAPGCAPPVNCAGRAGRGRCGREIRVLHAAHDRIYRAKRINFSSETHTAQLFAEL